MIGIYKITNQQTGQSYIGQSVDIKRRWMEHKLPYKRINPTKKIYQAFNQYGIDNFTFEVVEECEVNKLNEREQYWINYYDCYNNGYNMSRIQNLQSKIDWEVALKIVNDLSNTTLTETNIAEKYNVSVSLISQINTGKMWIIKDQIYPIRQKKEKKIGQKEKWTCPLTREQLKDKIRNQSFSEIGRECGYTDNAIRKWCDKYNLPRHKREIKKLSDEEWELI